jgi:hypothetical protein
MTMNGFAKWLIPAFALSLPMAAYAQGGDFAYCQALSAQYQKYYVKTSGHTISPGPIDGNVAVDQCRTGNTAAGIPVLEKKLRDAKVALPTRG